MTPQQDGNPPSKREFAKVLIKCENQPLIILSTLQDHIVGDSRQVHTSPQDIMAGVAQSFDREQWKILVRQQLHGFAGVR